MNCLKYILLAAVCLTTTGCISFDVKDVSNESLYSRFIGAKFKTQSNFTVLKDISSEEEATPDSFQLVPDSELKQAKSSDNIEIGNISKGHEITLEKVEIVTISSFIPPMRVAYVNVSINGKVYLCRTSAIFDLDGSNQNIAIKGEYVKVVN